MGAVLLLHGLFVAAALALRNGALEETPPVAVEVLWVEPAADPPAVETLATAEPPPSPMAPAPPVLEVAPPPPEPPATAIDAPPPAPAAPEPVVAAPEPAEIPAAPPVAEPVLLPKPKPVPPPVAVVPRREVPSQTAAPARQSEATAPRQEARLEPPPSAPLPPAPATVLPPSPIGSSMAKPSYPAEAMRRRLQGTVLLHIDVAASGVPTAAIVVRSSGYRLLDDAAVAGVLKWRFTPASRGGEAVASAVDHAVEFRLVD